MILFDSASGGNPRHATRGWRKVGKFAADEVEGVANPSKRGPQIEALNADELLIRSSSANRLLIANKLLGLVEVDKSVEV